MKKKIIFTLLICCIIVSCGRKADPEYKDHKKKSKIVTIYKDKA